MTIARGAHAASTAKTAIAIHKRHQQKTSPCMMLALGTTIGRAGPTGIIPKASTPTSTVKGLRRILCRRSNHMATMTKRTLLRRAERSPGTRRPLIVLIARRILPIFGLDTTAASTSDAILISWHATQSQRRVVVSLLLTPRHRRPCCWDFQK